MVPCARVGKLGLGVSSVFLCLEVMEEDILCQCSATWCIVAQRPDLNVLVIR